MNSGQRAESQYDTASGDWDAVRTNDELMRQQFYVESHQRFEQEQQRQWLGEVPEWVQGAAGALFFLAIGVLFLAYHVF